MFFQNKAQTKMYFWHSMAAIVPEQVMKKRQYFEAKTVAYKQIFHVQFWIQVSCATFNLDCSVLWCFSLSNTAYASC